MNFGTLAVATALGGCAIGLVMLSVVSWALFLMGSVVGGAVGYGAALVLQLKGVAYYGTLLIPGLLCGCLATKQQKKLTVLGTATGGALCAARAVRGAGAWGLGVRDGGTGGSGGV